ncbi:hypothetical protein V8E55_003874, partial [Tylopilus felleus]
PGSDGNTRGVETRAQRRVGGPGDHLGEEVELGCVKVDSSGENIRKRVEYDGIVCRKDGATSGARCDSKQVETRLLAETRANQHEHRQDTTNHVLAPSITPLDNARSPSGYVDPLRRRGRLRTRPKSVS